MIPVKPVIPGAEPIEYTLAEEQPEYMSLPVFKTELSMMSRWQLSDEERAQIAAGADIFIAQMNFGQQLQPILPMIGSSDDCLQHLLNVEEKLKTRS